MISYQSLLLSTIVLNGSGAYTLSIQVLKSENLIKWLALQRSRYNAVSSVSEYKYINYYMCTIATVTDYTL